ncbi:hypothetical protein SUGI_0809180 [Cryptomeria japonica]|uniref:bZIP transcription factor TRAB1 n=1 Tax=Cryptomeria japonica TaxID=3369 RepID=UPI002414C30A|nr:bZIP transcription factor TRAB1 [Cryptomeria japonica]GLJ39594.1 hypothetical protein SUGI_0809180 [Cryptomeria japonica]
MGSPGNSRVLGGGTVNSLVPGGTKMGSFSLARQTSIYSLTLEEFKNTLGEPGKNFGSMNMDEFLKNIWTAEESQVMAAAMGAAAADGTVGGNLRREASLQRQGSLTLPRTLSRKTVDEVWRDIYKENSTNADVNGNGCETTQRQATFHEMTLEDFLVKAGVVREDTEPYGGRFDNDEFGGFGGHSMERNEESLGGISNSLALGFPDRGGTVNGELRSNNGVMAGTLTLSPTSNALSNQAALDAMNMEALKSAHQQQTDWLNNQYRTAIAQQQQHQHHQHHHQLLQQQQEVADAAAAAVYASSVKRQGNGVLMGQGLGGALALSPTGMGNGLQGGLGVGLAGLGATALAIGAGSPANQLSSDGVGTSHGDNSTVSPMGYVMDSGLRGRKRGGPVEKVIERRQRRMIKNRESAARSRARKQAYTVELEAEVTQLKEENRELRKKQEEISEKCKKQITEMMASMSGRLPSQKETSRRTQSGPW